MVLIVCLWPPTLVPFENFSHHTPPFDVNTQKVIPHPGYCPMVLKCRPRMVIPFTTMTRGQPRGRNHAHARPGNSHLSPHSPVRGGPAAAEGADDHVISHVRKKSSSPPKLEENWRKSAKTRAAERDNGPKQRESERMCVSRATSCVVLHRASRATSGWSVYLSVGWLFWSLWRAKASRAGAPLREPPAERSRSLRAREWRDFGLSELVARHRQCHAR